MIVEKPSMKRKMEAAHGNGKVVTSVGHIESMDRILSAEHFPRIKSRSGAKPQISAVHSRKV